MYSTDNDTEHKQTMGVIYEDKVNTWGQLYNAAVTLFLTPRMVI